MITYECFMALCHNLRKNNVGWRWGQVVSNAASMLGFPVDAGMKNDPFFRSEMSQEFIDWLIREGWVIK